MAREAVPAATLSPPGPAPAEITAERRLVTVLFADLVGFTPWSESRDAEEARDLLSRYFEMSRTLIARYGGTIEKFIGDAVMAVWGAPVATETDSERAVRAALDLVASIPDLDPGLQARAGVLTGEAAVTVGGDDQGMVAGDLVNTASRIQSSAIPGTVVVGESTRGATAQAIVFESAGSQELKGKSEPMELWRALRVVSGVGGQLKSPGLEAPFVGRERELKLIKELFHGCAQDRRAHLVSITGIAGIGKSRLAWEFYKYFDGIVEPVYWHRGRCLAYGEGVTYWALADMVRMRCRIGEDDEPEVALNKLKTSLEEYVVEPEERAFIEPRLAQLIGLEGAPAGDRQDLFAAWRLFFETLAKASPTVLAFEDMQWADSSLLDFVEYLLEWSRDLPLYVITLARPELQERRPSWGAGQRNFTTLYLEPLARDAMEELLQGLVPGLSEKLRDQILARAEGVPLYAVETARMLVDRGLLVREGAVYHPTGDIATLDVPVTLYALISARLDGLSPDERKLLQDGAVLGKTFTRRAVTALAGLPAEDVDAMLSSLARKEVLGVQSDPRSPERGQYGFLQDLVRHVAYETISKRERKSMHLAAAAHLKEAFAQEDEVAEVLASHYLAAYEAAPDAVDAPEIRAQAREMLTRAGKRAGSLGAPDEGQRYYERAAALADDQVVEAGLLELAGRQGIQANRQAEARQQLERALSLYEEAGDMQASARAGAALADADFAEGRLEEGQIRLEGALAQLEHGEPTTELATTLAQLGRMRVVAGHWETAGEPLERALTLAERLQMPEVFVEALTSKALVVFMQGRPAESLILLQAAIARAYEEELYASALRAENNLGFTLEAADRYGEVVDMGERAVALARRRGDRRWETALRAGNLTPLFLLGRWDEAVAIADLERQTSTDVATAGQLLYITLVHCERGDLESANTLIFHADELRDADNPQVRATYAVVEARILRAEGRHAEAFVAAERGLALQGGMALSNTEIKLAFVEAVEAAFALSDLVTVEKVLSASEALDPGDVTPFRQAQNARLKARLDAAHGDHTRVEENFRTAAGLFREFDMTFYLAVTQLEYGEWLIAQDRRPEALDLLEEARATFEQLRATPWLGRAGQAMPSATEQEPALP
ncbi:MAG: AAA family ATPase [Actinomycetota bacterium]|nr:AAA family ATPase [Actinomycetota bacterium]